MKKLVRMMMVVMSVLSVVLGALPSLTRVKAQDLKEINIAYMPNFASLHDIIAGVEGGFFEEEGLKVNLVEFADGPTIIAAMESGSIDIGNIGPGAHVLPIQKRAEIIAFAQLGNADEVIGRKDKGVEKIEDLKGKKIASASGTSAEAILNLTLAEAGLTADDVEIVDMDASAIVTAMISGSVDAAATWSPNTTAIKKELGDTAVMLSNNVRYAKESPSVASYAVTPGYVEKNKETVEKFLRGLYKAMDYRAKNMDQVAEWVATKIAVDVATVNDQLLDGDWLDSTQMKALLEDGSLKIYYEKQQENFIKGGRLTDEDKRPVEEYVHLDLMKAALEQLAE
ncbi:ABC transporter substrate-binding protein [Aerococcaceae bacterium NML191292]|nr:ABC transporter substrate-binding protein [Aerococcaceae bacterium NML191292]MCW6666585.1 ABC transporter substrate-binding protein [Aerococcaceae bacterium NML190938]MCW6679861.1 ABC transporter substrate-binding protein [Aerococcaceae bacterium NML130460]MCW6681731.1 ABC transporter substrate-binding protein [Aerococcaceae bacterium NML160702]MDO4774683.1 ABC transporter substrate-binding protein [Aerococcaceae bacterium]